MSEASDLAVQSRIRKQAAAQFRSAGIPNRRIEDWKYSDLRTALGDTGLSEATASWRVNAVPRGVEIFDLAEPIWPEFVQYQLGSLKGNALGAASLALASGGVALRVDELTDTPLELDFTGAGNIRTLIKLYPGASLTLIERLSGTEQRNIGIEIFLGKDAVLRHVRIAPSVQGAVQVEQIAASLDRGARYQAHFANFGAKLSRTELHIVLEGEGAQANLSGVSVLDGGHADVTTHVDHAVGDTRSTQLFKNIAGGHSRAVYQGKVTVRPGANGSDSRQTAKGLLLGARAEIDLKPELEILADDVKCAHGAAVGDLDLESLFYLRSRGLSEADARALLMRAFLGDAIDEIEKEEIRAAVWMAVEAALTKASEVA